MPLQAALPKGTRDFLPGAMQQREYIVNTLKEAFKKYGFNPIETPALEKVETLTGKYGEEGDRLVFKLLPRGKKLNQALADGKMESRIEEALRYDLTVPFARFVVQNQNELTFPFKRFQIQPVWRADRPQKGRFREFVQCDADAVGSTSLLQEVEFLALYQEVFKALQLPVILKLNNRKLLFGLAEAFGVQDRFGHFTVALDKLDKIGAQGVLDELTKLQFPVNAVNGFKKILTIGGSNQERLEQLGALCAQSEIGKKGLEELEVVLEGAQNLGISNLQLDITLARGLDYYTGSIFEVTAQGVEMGSIGGGGRYDDLTGIFGKKDLPGIGISFGLDRIQICLQELGLFPDLKEQSTEVLFANFGNSEALFSLGLVQKLRTLGVKAEVYPDAVKLRKQLDFANKNGMAYVVLIGEKEMEAGSFGVKNMSTGEQQQLREIELLEQFNPQNQLGHGLH